jgi:16S rRNA processing protein RimM
VNAKQPAALRGRRLIALGAVMGSHGVQGELRVKPYNEDSELLPSLEQLVLRTKDGRERMCEIESVRPGTKGWIFAITGIDTPEDAHALLGAELCVPRDELPALGPGEFYFTDLPGLSAVTPDGAPVGRVKEVLEYPASTALAVETSDGVLEVPMIGPYLVSVDVPGGRVIVDHLSDLEIEKPRSASKPRSTS